MATDDDFMQLLYVVARIALGFLTLFCIIGLIIGIVDATDHTSKSEYIIWAIVALILCMAGFFAAWKEHLFATLLFAIGQLIMILAGISFSYMQIYTRGVQGAAIIVGFIYAILLYVRGARDLHPLPITC